MAVFMQRNASSPTEASVKAEVYPVAIVFTALAALAVIFRMLARYRCMGIYGRDDWLMVVGLVRSVAE